MRDLLTVEEHITDTSVEKKRSLQTTLPRELSDKLIATKQLSRKKCHICPSKIYRKSQISCAKCSKNICSKHSSVI